ncbi:MAG TPA: polymer-forming cytoskeletal protein [Pyrinomonadaceae bacterium]|nr:polymer-forming cytoskeletal protein [Pyrinomonadaceae bacterium]
MDAILAHPIFNGRAPRRAALVSRSASIALLLFGFAIAVCAQSGTSPAAETYTPGGADEVVVGGNYASDVFGLGRSVRVRGSVRHGVIAFGGDVIVEGRVEGDVASIGGSVIQREGSYIGGDVMVLGGAYHHGKEAPGRNPLSKTIMFAGYEHELRQLARNPASLLTPELSLAYLGQRLLAVLFWFIISLALTAVTPGAVSRAASRLQLTSLRVALIGLLGAVVLGPGVAVALRMLPPAVGSLVLILALLLLVVAYLFGRVVINATTGRWLQRVLLAEERRSESVALLLGAGFWAVVLALPYVWPVVVAGLIIVSLGLSLTSRYRINWKRA